MSRRVRRRVERRGTAEVEGQEIERLSSDMKGVVDWKRLPDDTVIQLFSCLNYRDRASLSSTCRTWRFLGKSPCLWQELDLRPHKCDAAAAASLASRCENLQKLQFRGPESAGAIINLQARGLRQISVDGCRKITDASLSVLAARHEALECLQLGPDLCERISSDALKAIAICCLRLQKLRLTGIHEIDADAINALAKYCPNLMDIGFIDCRKVDETAMGNVTSVCFLSVAGTRNIKWGLILQHWKKLPHLTGLDVSRTDITPHAALTLVKTWKSLKVLCALNCRALEEDASFVYNNNHKGKFLFAVSTDNFKVAASLFADTTKNERNVFLDWRNMNVKDRKLDEVMKWLEWTLCYALLRISESNPPGLDNFWLHQGTSLLLSFMQSAEEEVQERAATALATFVVIDDENASIDPGRAEAVIRVGGIRLLLNLARSWREGPQSEAAKAIANLSVNANVAKAVAEEGGINVLVNMARSMNRLVAEEAAGGLWNVSVGEEHKGAIAESGGVKALVDLICKWSGTAGGEGVLERAAGALANLAADDKCSLEVALAGGIPALVTLARSCKVEGVQEQSARALANLAAHGDSNSNNAAVGEETGALEALVQLTRSSHDGVKQEAAGALWNLSFDDSNREAIAAAGGIESLMHALDIGVFKFANCACWCHALICVNSWWLVGPQTKLHLCLEIQNSEQSSSEPILYWIILLLNFFFIYSLMLFFLSLFFGSGRVLATMMKICIFCRLDQVATESISKSVSLDGARRMALKHVETFILSFSNPQAFSAASASLATAALTQVLNSVRIQDAGHLRCSGAEIGRFVSMLRNPYSILKACAAFALLQFTVPGGRHAKHHVRLLRNTGAPRVLRAAAAATGAPLEAKIFARIVLRNLEHQIESQAIS
ncbi:protein ARABIDILLO 1-like [Olea europaea var. sylvestris]|uniref:protein ARABIDILLO 1-like n=1 Tax=Olea europaea var. sylvestris TaxID=158386 RepID=UPI000C1CD434|nr:protein ARABIDILLO 1-like [Olea europaea var. sylvestris]